MAADLYFLPFAVGLDRRSSGPLKTDTLQSLNESIFDSVPKYSIDADY